jgi:hypothetical protein
VARSPQWVSLAFGVVFHAVWLTASAGAETFNLELKQLEPLRAGPFSGVTGDYSYRGTRGEYLPRWPTSIGSGSA